jgi:hypothetical protein
MPRVRRKGHKQRDVEIPVSERSLRELNAELKRLRVGRGELDPWQAFKRTVEIEDELAARQRNKCPA